MTGVWASLFSGGKDSSWALYQALESDRQVTRLVTVHPSKGSYMYHVPATHLSRLASESIGIPLLEVEPADFEADSPRESGAQGDHEIEPLEVALSELTEELDLIGLTAGAVASEYQTSRIEAMCTRLDLDLFAPLWQEDPRTLAERMLAAGFEITIIQVAARGLDETWLGRTLDREALEALEDLNESYGVHLLGEGGEYETLVTNGPHMSDRIEFTSEQVWEGSRGHLEIQDAWLA